MVKYGRWSESRKYMWTWIWPTAHTRIHAASEHYVCFDTKSCHYGWGMGRMRWWGGWRDEGVGGLAHRFLSFLLCTMCLACGPCSCLASACDFDAERTGFPLFIIQTKLCTRPWGTRQKFQNKFYVCRCQGPSWACCHTWGFASTFVSVNK